MSLRSLALTAPRPGGACSATVPLPLQLVVGCAGSAVNLHELELLEGQGSTRPARSRPRSRATVESLYSRNLSTHVLSPAAQAAPRGTLPPIHHQCQERQAQARIAAHSGPRARVLSSATAPDIAAGLVAGTL